MSLYRMKGVYTRRTRAFLNRVTNRYSRGFFIPYGQHEATISHISLADTFENLLGEPRASRRHPMPLALLPSLRSSVPLLTPRHLSDPPSSTEETPFCRASTRSSPLGPRSPFLGFANLPPVLPFSSPKSAGRVPAA